MYPSSMYALTTTDMSPTNEGHAPPTPPPAYEFSNPTSHANAHELRDLEAQ